MTSTTEDRNQSNIAEFRANHGRVDACASDDRSGHHMFVIDVRQAESAIERFPA